MEFLVHKNLTQASSRFWLYEVHTVKPYRTIAPIFCALFIKWKEVFKKKQKYINTSKLLFELRCLCVFPSVCPSFCKKKFFVQNGSNSQIRWTDISNSRIQAQRAWRLVKHNSWTENCMKFKIYTNETVKFIAIVLLAHLNFENICSNKIICMLRLKFSFYEVNQ